MSSPILLYLKFRKNTFNEIGPIKRIRNDNIGSKFSKWNFWSDICYLDFNLVIREKWVSLVNGKSTIRKIN